MYREIGKFEGVVKLEHVNSIATGYTGGGGGAKEKGQFDYRVVVEKNGALIGK